MTEAQKPVEKRPAPQPTATADFSEAIEQTMQRQPDEEVRCVWLFEDRYRCNWWVRGKSNNWLSFTTSVIRKSVFLRATRKADKLVIEDLSKPR